MPKDADDEPGVNAILSSLERRWAKADQEVFIAAVLVNPLFHWSPFSKSSHFSNANIISLFTRLWKRFNNTTDRPPSEFYQQVGNWLDLSGVFANLFEVIEIERSQVPEVSLSY